MLAIVRIHLVYFMKAESSTIWLLAHRPAIWVIWLRLWSPCDICRHHTTSPFSIITSPEADTQYTHMPAQCLISLFCTHTLSNFVLATAANVRGVLLCIKGGGTLSIYSRFLHVGISPHFSGARQILHGSSSVSKAGDLTFWGTLLPQKPKIRRIGQCAGYAHRFKHCRRDVPM